MRRREGGRLIEGVPEFIEQFPAISRGDRQNGPARQFDLAHFTVGGIEFPIHQIDNKTVVYAGKPIGRQVGFQIWSW